MTNISNQLNINNLIKTKWKEQFSQEQFYQIALGLYKKVDVSSYANPDFTVEQMAEIRFGLEDGLDVSSYANPDLTWKQMEKMRLKLITEWKMK